MLSSKGFISFNCWLKIRVSYLIWKFSVKMQEWCLSPFFDTTALDGPAWKALMLLFMIAPSWPTVVQLVSLHSGSFCIAVDLDLISPCLLHILTSQGGIWSVFTCKTTTNRILSRTKEMRRGMKTMVTKNRHIWLKFWDKQHILLPIYSSQTSISLSTSSTGHKIETESTIHSKNC